MQISNIVDVEVRTSGSPDLRYNVTTAETFAQSSFVRNLLIEELIHGCQTQALHGVSPNPHAAIDSVVE